MVRVMANTTTRPSIGGPTGLVTYVDATGLLYPALVSADFAPPSGTGSLVAGSIDLEYIDTNPSDVFPIADLTSPARGRKSVRANNVPDQGNIGGTTVNTATTAPVTSNCTLTNSSTSVTVTGSTAGIPAAGSVSGAGVVAGTTYTISGSTVTLSQNSTSSAAGTGVPLTFTTFAATVSSATGVPASGFVTGAGIPAGTTYTISSTTVTLSVAATATQAAAPLTFSATAFTTPYWRYPTAYTI